MKHLKKIFAIVIIGLIAQGVYSAQVAVTEIEVVDTTTLTVTLSENPNIDIGEVNAEITILQDVKLYGGFATGDNPREVELLLEDPLFPNTNYSLLSVLGSDGSIDFLTPAAVEGFTANNIASVSEQDINTIEIIDNKTIRISYTQDLIDTVFEYKLLGESKVKTIEKKDYDIPELTISVEPPLLADQDYILMVIDMQDRDGNYIEFDTGIYDFHTPAAAIEEETATGVIMEDIVTPESIAEENTGIEEESHNNETPLEEGALQEDTLDLQAAGEVDTVQTASGALATEEAAMMTQTTPDTGAATWVLILMTLIINTFYYFTRRKKLSFA